MFTGNALKVVTWLGLLSSILWLSGIATLLALLSHASWLAREDQTSFRTILVTPRLRRSVPLSLAVISSGVMLGSGSWLERGAWLALTLYFGVLAAQGRWR